MGSAHRWSAAPTPAGKPAAIYQRVSAVTPKPRLKATKPAADDVSLTYHI